MGDDVRHIHWRATAHAGELMVRENLETTVPNGVVVLDVRRAAHTDQSFEDVDRGGRLAARGVPARTGARCSWPPRAVWPVLPEGAPAGRPLDELAAVGPDDGLDMPTGSRRIAPVWSRAASVVLVTGSPPGRRHRAGGWAVSPLRRRQPRPVRLLGRGRPEPRRAVGAPGRLAALAFAAMWNQAHG